MKSSLAAVGLAAGLVAGGAAGLVLVPAAALGQTTAPPASAPSDTVVPAERGQHLRDTLAPLVANGTITQAQAEKVIAALQAAKPVHGPGGLHHRFHIAFGTVATTLGVTEEQLHTALRSGESIADVARSKGIAPQKVVDALLAEAKTRLDKQVAAGDLTQAEADARLSKAKGMFTSLVNGDLPKMKMQRGGTRGPADVPAAGTEGTVERAEYPAA
ncbi:MAG TPA: hypothetical protein VNA14_09785 [Mycobacteriales bacterium]|nr:hypothetical protein [Mycobacteriales bacterium]